MVSPHGIILHKLKTALLLAVQRYDHFIMEERIEINEFTLFVKSEGTGTPILMLHSYWGNQSLFDSLANFLKVTHRIIRIDLPGHGLSSVPPTNYHFDTFSPILHELILKLNIHQKIIVLGHSMGGYAAMAFAAKFPDLIEKLILMHSPVQQADEPSIKLRNREAMLIEKGKKELLLQATISSNFAPENSDRFPNVVHALYQSASQVSQLGALQSIIAMNTRSNYLNFLQTSPFPIFIMIGEQDMVYDSADQLKDALTIPKAKTLWLKESGHLGFFEEENKVFEGLNEFLEVEN
jgi:pimeloyl-ACP methyl ester carboxylesterase